MKELIYIIKTDTGFKSIINPTKTDEVYGIYDYESGGYFQKSKMPKNLSEQVVKDTAISMYMQEFNNKNKNK